MWFEVCIWEQGARELPDGRPSSCWVLETVWGGSGVSGVE